MSYTSQELNVVICELKLSRNNFEIISMFYFTCNHIWNWNKITSAAERVTKLFHKLFQRHGTCWKIFMGCNSPL